MVLKFSNGNSFMCKIQFLSEVLKDAEIAKLMLFDAYTFYQHTTEAFFGLIYIGYIYKPSTTHVISE